MQRIMCWAMACSLVLGCGGVDPAEESPDYPAEIAEITQGASYTPCQGAVINATYVCWDQVFSKSNYYYADPYTVSRAVATATEQCFGASSTRAEAMAECSATNRIRAVRMYSSGTYWYSPVAPKGIHEATWYLAGDGGAGRWPLYLCRTKKNYIFASLHLNCEGNLGGGIGPMGYSFGAHEPGVIPVYRCQTWWGDLFVSPNINCDGHSLHGLLAYVKP